MKTIIIRNLTPHAINFVLPGETRTLAPDPAGPARVAETICPDTVKEVSGVPVIRKILGEITGLPAPVPGVALLVSALVATAAWALQRTDVLAIGETVRDPAGRITGATSLASHPIRGFLS